MMLKTVSNWRKRHRNTTNFWLHVIGIPTCFVVAPAVVVLGQFWLAIALFLAGYALQFLGHLVEGNRSGEEVLIREILARRSRRRKH